MSTCPGMCYVSTWSDEYHGYHDQSTDDEYNKQRDDDASPVLVVRVSAHQLLSRQRTITGIETIMLIHICSYQLFSSIFLPQRCIDTAN